MNTETQIPENETVAQKALRLLSPIPADQWCTDKYSDGVNSCCARGHLNRLTSPFDPNNYSRDSCGVGWGNTPILTTAVREFFEKQYNIKEFFELLAAVNDDNDIAIYTEETPKDRVIHLLTDMVAAGY